MPARDAPRRGGRAASAPSSSSRGGAGGLGRRRGCPPAAYGPPAIRAANSSAAVAGEHEMGVAVDEARDHAAAVGVEPLVGRRAGAARSRATRSPSITTRGVAHDPERPVAERRVVRDEQADVVDDERVIAASPRGSPRAARAATSIVACRPSRDDLAAVDDHVVTSAALAANTTASSAFSGVAPAGARRPSETVTRSAGAPGRDPPGIGPAEAGVPVRGRRAQQLGGRGGARARRVARRSSSSTARASSNRSITAWESLPSASRGARVDQRPHPADAVGEVALGRRADAAQARGVAEQRRRRRRSRWVACTAVKRASSAPASASSRGRRAAVGRRGTPRSRPAAPTRGRAAAGRARAPSAATIAAAVGIDRAHAVDRRADRADSLSARARRRARPRHPRCRRRSAAAPRPAASPMPPCR